MSSEHLRVNLMCLCNLLLVSQEEVEPQQMEYQMRMVLHIMLDLKLELRLHG